MLGTLAWYLVSLALSGPGVVGYVLPVSAAWSLAAAVGAAFGLAGALWRDGNPTFRATSIALLAGALAGEAWLLLGEWTGRAARLVLALRAPRCPFRPAARAPPHARRAHAGAVLVAAVGIAGVEHAARDTIRMVGWNGLTTPRSWFAARIPAVWIQTRIELRPRPRGFIS